MNKVKRLSEALLVWRYDLMNEGKPWVRIFMHRLILVLVLLLSLPVQAELLTSEDSEEAVAEQTPRLKQQLAKAGFEWGAPIFVRIYKQSNLLELWLKKGEKFELFRSYPVCERSGLLGPKVVEGDDQAPEGFYSVNEDWMHPFSSFHLAFNIRYPNDYDRLLERTGSAIMVHGGCSSSGCFAMTDEAIEEIYTLAETALRSGQREFKVHVFPFPLTDANLAKYSQSKWYDFWMNLKEGYDFFEQHRVPPNEFVVDGRYVFEETTRDCSMLACEGKVCTEKQKLRDEAVDSLWEEIMKAEAELTAANEKAPAGEPDGASQVLVD